MKAKFRVKLKCPKCSNIAVYIGEALIFCLLCNWERER